MKYLLFILLMFSGLNSHSQESNCKTERSYGQRDILFCNEDLSYSVITRYYTDVNLGESLSRSIEFKYIEEAVRLAADEGFDSRFDYEPSSDEPGTVDLIYPSDGEFVVFLTIIDGIEFVFVHWADIDDESFSIVFEKPESYKPVYSLFEN